MDVRTPSRSGSACPTKRSIYCPGVGSGPTGCATLWPSLQSPSESEAKELSANARVVTDDDEDGMARRLLASKYQGWREGQVMSGWARTAVPVALDPS